MLPDIEPGKDQKPDTCQQLLRICHVRQFTAVEKDTPRVVPRVSAFERINSSYCLVHLIRRNLSTAKESLHFTLELCHPWLQDNATCTCH